MTGPRPVKVWMAPSLVALAQNIADVRRRTNNHAGVEDKIQDRAHQLRNEFIGVLGEIAYGKWANLYVDLSWEPRSGTPDFLSRSGFTVDVKTSCHPSGDLSVTEAKEKKRTDYYVSVRVPENVTAEYKGGMVVELVGWVPEKIVFGRDTIAGIRGPYYRVPFVELNEFPQAKGGAR